MASSLEIRPVNSKRELTAFIKLPFRLYAGEPNWVAPLTFERRRFLDRSSNPYFKHARAEYFLAYRNGKPVGRITAQVDDNYQEFHSNKWGFFGFFEAEHDPEVATALVEAASAWLEKQGCDRMVGPCDFTTNDPCGVLVEGFERPPIVMTPWTHRYYPEILEEAGMSKAMDLFMWDLEMSDKDEANPVLWRLSEQLEKRHGVKLRRMRKRDLASDFEHFRDVFNTAWKDNWGFVPLTKDEVRYYAKEMKPILAPEWTFIAEKGDEVIAAALSLPDYNQVLRHLNGRLLPFGWLKALYYRRKIDRVRVFALGVKPEYQHTGVAAKLYTDHFDMGQEKGIYKAETGWILEVNRNMNRAMEAMHGKLTRKYRLYERALGDVTDE